jgi:hypothetical protein
MSRYGSGDEFSSFFTWAYLWSISFISYSNLCGKYHHQHLTSPSVSQNDGLVG